jgi:predicted glycosyltransferase
MRDARPHFRSQKGNQTSRWGWGLRFLLYSHDGLGLGHIRRNLAIASALINTVPKASILIATSAQHVDDLGVPPRGVDVLKIPAIRKVDNDRYAARSLPIPEKDLRALRSTLLSGAVESFRPDVVLADKHPVGAQGELRGALMIHRSRGGGTVLGLRDILDHPVALMREWASHDIMSLIAEHYDRVLVYGDRNIFDPVRAYEFHPSVAARTTFCGYVCNSPVFRRPDSPAADAKRPIRAKVLATVGGGEDGFSRAEAFINAAKSAPWTATVVAGPCGTPSEQRALRCLADDAGVAYHTFIDDLPERLGQADALVCMGGYNTLVEALSKGTPTVCLPRASPRMEQLLRATAFARLGLLRVLRPEQIDACALRESLTEVLTWSRHEVSCRARAALDFAGAEHAAASLAEVGRRKGALLDVVG